MATSRAEGKRSFKCKAVEEEEEEDDDVGDLGFGEDDKKKQREMMTSSSKRAYGSGGSTPVVVCQVENCNADFADAKPYHRRHKVCELHFKAPAVHLHGLQKRFCQQCSRQIFVLKISADRVSIVSHGASDFSSPTLHKLSLMVGWHLTFLQMISKSKSIGSSHESVTWRIVGMCP